MTVARTYRYYVRSRDGRAIYGFDRIEAATVAALEYGVGAHLVDTMAQAYFPVAQEVKLDDKGERTLEFLPIGGWDCGRFSPDRDLIEAIKKGHVAIVHAWLARGADANARDDKGGPALHWATARGRTDIVALLLKSGADATARDLRGQSALEIAKAKGHAEIAELLEQHGAE